MQSWAKNRTDFASFTSNDEKGEGRVFSAAGLETLASNSTVQSKLKQLRKKKLKQKTLRTKSSETANKRRWVRRNAEVWEEALYYPSGIIKTDDVSKLRSDGTWIKRAIALTPEICCFMHTSEGYIVDSVPLEDVERVTLHWRPRSRDVVRKKVKKATSMLEIDTRLEGYTGGRTYVVKFATARKCNEWISKLRYYTRKRVGRVQNKSRTEKRQEWARLFQKTPFYRTTIVCLIIVNFLVNIVQAQISPSGAVLDTDGGDNLWYSLDLMLTAFFFFELCFNMYTRWFWKFWTNGWCVFDFFVVSVSIVAIVFDTIPEMGTLKTLRTFRVLRIIGRYKKLRRITGSIVTSLVPVLNAFLIGLIVTLIFSIIGVAAYSVRAQDNFGTFARAMFTLFVLMAFDEWWAGDDLPAFAEDRSLNWSVVFFQFSFVVILNWTILQVVVAVLLDNFVASTQQQDLDEALKRQKKNRTVTHPLDPILHSIYNSYDTDVDLQHRIQMIFQKLDSDGQGMVSFVKMREGFRRLDVKPQVHLSHDDFELIMEQAALPEGVEELDEKQFSILMVEQVEDYVTRMVSDAVVVLQGGSPEKTALLHAFKVMLMEKVDAAEQRDAHKAERRLRRLGKMRGNLHSITSNTVPTPGTPGALTSIKSALGDNLVGRRSSAGLLATRMGSSDEQGRGIRRGRDRHQGLLESLCQLHDEFHDRVDGVLRALDSPQLSSDMDQSAEDDYETGGMTSGRTSRTGWTQRTVPAAGPYGAENHRPLGVWTDVLRGIVDAPGGKGEVDMSVREEVQSSMWSGSMSRFSQMYGTGGVGSEADERDDVGSLRGQVQREANLLNQTAALISVTRETRGGRLWGEGVYVGDDPNDDRRMPGDVGGIVDTEVVRRGLINVGSKEAAGAPARRSREERGHGGRGRGKAEYAGKTASMWVADFQGRSGAAGRGRGRGDGDGGRERRMGGIAESEAEEGASPRKQGTDSEVMAQFQGRTRRGREGAVQEQRREGGGRDRAGGTDSEVMAAFQGVSHAPPRQLPRGPLEVGDEREEESRGEHVPAGGGRLAGAPGALTDSEVLGAFQGKSRRQSKPEDGTFTRIPVENNRRWSGEGAVVEAELGFHTPHNEAAGARAGARRGSAEGRYANAAETWEAMAGPLAGPGGWVSPRGAEAAKDKRSGSVLNKFLSPFRRSTKDVAVEDLRIDTRQGGMIKRAVFDGAEVTVGWEVGNAEGEQLEAVGAALRKVHR